MIQTMRAGVGTQHPEQIVNFFGSYLTAVGGVLNASGSDNLKVVASDTPDMEVHVSLGRALITQADGLMAYPVWIHTAPEDVAVASNGSGNPRVDTIVAYIDKSETPDPDVDNIAKIARVAGTPSASPVAPDATAIQSAIGGANPYIILADVRVNSGATELASDKITDRRTDAQINLYNPKIQGSKQDWVTLTDGATINIDLAKGNKFRVTIAGNRTFTISNAKAGQTFELRIKQDGTGNRTATFTFTPYTILWQDGVAPVLTPTANKVDKIGFEIMEDGSTIDGTVISQNH